MLDSESLSEFKRTQVVGSERDAISCVHGRFICIDSELQTGFFYNARAAAM